MTAFYIHYPYCKSKCPYCDFNSHEKKDIDFDGLTQSYLREINYFSENARDKKINTIFFGGGTPSLMPIPLVAEILSQISQKFSIADDCEISLEANPTSSEARKFQDLRNIGVNRLSIGVQALNANDLKFLGREHSTQDALKTIEIAHNFFDNFSFDLIYARPQQTIAEWHKELMEALSFKAPHLSLYQLTIEKGTKFFSQFQRQEFIMPSENLASDFYETTNQIMAQSGFNHYEISNYAKKDFECRHNLAYWRSEDYIGIGAGAHSRVYFNNKEPRQAIQMVAEPSLWIKTTQINQNGIQKIINIDKKELIEEITMMGLRLREGIDLEIFKKHLNCALEKSFYEIFDEKKLNFLLQNDFLTIKDNKLFIPQHKRILTNSIIEKLVF